MKYQDPFGFAKAIQVPKDKKTIDKVHKILFKNGIKKSKTCPYCQGEGIPMGKLGTKQYMKCRNCGMVYEK